MRPCFTNRNGGEKHKYRDAGHKRGGRGHGERPSDGTGDRKNGGFFPPSGLLFPVSRLLFWLSLFQKKQHKQVGIEVFFGEAQAFCQVLVDHSGRNIHFAGYLPDFLTIDPP